jgi:hypothetical protein
VECCYHFVQSHVCSCHRLYRTVTLPVVSHGCGTWSVTLRGGHRLRVFENGVLRGVCGPKRQEVTGEWRKLHNEKLHDLYCSPTRLQ